MREGDWKGCLLCLFLNNDDSHRGKRIETGGNERWNACEKSMRADRIKCGWQIGKCQSWMLPKRQLQFRFGLYTNENRNIDKEKNI